jgi:hypothetical protein
MSLNQKSTSIKAKASPKKDAIVSESVGNYEKHPFFIKKAGAAKALISQVGLPKQLTTKKSHA